MLWNDIAHSAYPVSSLSSVHLVAEKGEHYRSEKGSPSNPPSTSSSCHQMRGQWSGRQPAHVYVLSRLNTVCVWRVGVHHWGMCTCNFSHLTQLAFCRVSGTGRCLWMGRITQTTDDQIVWQNRSDACTHILSLESKQSLEQAADPYGSKKESKKKNPKTYGSKENKCRSYWTLHIIHISSWFLFFFSTQDPDRMLQICL